jgi:DNA repair protein RadC
LLATDENTSTGYREATFDEIMTGARQALATRVRKGTVFTSPKVTADYLIARLGQLQHEGFTLIYVDLC